VKVDALNVRGRAPEFPRVLPAPHRHQGAVRLAVTEESTVGKLAIAISGNDLLNKDLFRLDLPTCFGEQIA
jgi:hypothetical protein